jgi:hypothetical protein
MTASIALLISTLSLAADPGAATKPTEESTEWSRWTVGLDVLVPRQASGRLLELPFALAVETASDRHGPVEGALRFSLGYGQLSRAEACATADCLPLLSFALGALVRVGSPPDQPVAGWLSLGGGLQGASNWDVAVGGAYLRADAGVDLGGSEKRRLRLSVGWVEGWFTENRPDLEPGHQRYLAFTLAFGPGKAPPSPPPAAAPLK